MNIEFASYYSVGEIRAGFPTFGTHIELNRWLIYNQATGETLLELKFKEDLTRDEKFAIGKALYTAYIEVKNER